jgi:hypothetical protein
MIYRLDKEKNRVIPCEEADLKSKNILERQHIERWIENYPDILGEELLVITTEYDKFDKTNERLDILAIDKEGNLVIVELKRDDSGKRADLQAIKYAAYCSTLRLDDVCELHKDYSKKRGYGSTDEPRQKILGFIENEEFEEFSDRPRVILVARQFRPEVTASVMWLRKFGLDVSCVRLSPYEMGSGEIAFESNILIPLPDAGDFIVKTERKESRSLTVSQEEYFRFYRDLISRMKLKVARDYLSPQPKSYYQIPTGKSGIHYEWAFHGRPRSSFGVELHFERGNRDSNLEFLSHLEKHISRLEVDLQETVIVQKNWGRNWSRLYVEKHEGQFTDELKEWAVQKMAIMIKGVQPVLDAIE